MSRARDRLERVLAPEVVEALDEFVAEALAEALAAERSANGRRRGFVTVAEASEATGLTARAIRAQASRGRIPSKRLGTRILVDLDALGA